VVEEHATLVLLSSWAPADPSSALVSLVSPVRLDVSRSQLMLTAVWLSAPGKLLTTQQAEGRTTPDAEGLPCVRVLAGLDIGDVEIIRNAGGRVAADVVRSLFVAQVGQTLTKP